MCTRAGGACGSVLSEERRDNPNEDRPKTSCLLILSVTRNLGIGELQVGVFSDREFHSISQASQLDSQRTAQIIFVSLPTSSKRETMSGGSFARRRVGHMLMNIQFILHTHTRLGDRPCAFGMDCALVDSVNRRYASCC